MNNKGISADEYFLLLDQKEGVYKELTRFGESKREEYSSLLREFEEVNSKKISKDKSGRKIFNTTHKGKVLEQLVVFLMDNTGLFEVHENIRNTTNEIDQLLKLTFRGQHFKEYLPFKADMLLSECKNYNKAIDVTWVGKFYSLLISNHTRYGILFSYHGLTGKGWNDALGLTKKLFLHKERMEDKIYIINFDYKDFKLIEEGKSFLEIITAKIDELLTTVEYTKYLKLKHPALED